MTKTVTPSDHAGADLRISDVRSSKQFIDALNELQCPLPWGSNDVGQIYDADTDIVCVIEFPEAAEQREAIAAMIVMAVNTCGSFRATRRDEPKTD